MRQTQIENGSKTEVIVRCISPADLAQFDAKLKDAGIRNRSEAHAQRYPKYRRHGDARCGATRQLKPSVF
jgi:hypothetical protein